MESKLKLKVYYDGLCKLCSREMDHYRKQVGAENIDFIDICAPQFDATLEALDPVLVHKIMHVRRPDGTLATRVDAFIEIWKVLPRYNILGKTANLPIVKSLLEMGYTGFATIRPWLPRNSAKNECKDSPYCEVKDV